MMEEIIRPFEAPVRSPGFRVQPRQGLNEARPLLDIGAPDGQQDFSPFARVDEPEDYGWWPRLKMLLAGGQEVTSIWKDVSTTFEIDPNVCGIWRLRCHSEALSLSFVALESPTWINKFLIWNNVARIATVQIIIDWQIAASNTRTLSLSGVKFTAGTAPDWTATTGIDVLQVEIGSDGGMYGAALALDTRVP